MVLTERLPAIEIPKPLAGHFDLLPPFEFVKDVREELKVAEKYVFAKAMHAELGHATGPFLDLLVNTAQKGIYVRLDLDDYAKSLTDAKANIAIPFIRNPDKRAHRQFRKAMNKWYRDDFLREQGIDVQYHEAPFGFGKVFPLFGCDHVKALVIDDKVAYVGGMNFSDANFLSRDFMIKITDAEMIGAITELIESPPNRDVSLVFPDSTQFFYDSGNLGKSIVLANDLRVLNNSRESFYVASGFLPDGRFLDELKEAMKRGVDVKVFVKPYEQKGFDPIRSILHRTQKEIIKRGIPTYAPDEPVHAKAFIADGKIARIGSHNFTTTSQWAQTREFALQTHNAHVIEQLQKFFHSLESESQPLSQISV